MIFVSVCCEFYNDEDEDEDESFMQQRCNLSSRSHVCSAADSPESSMFSLRLFSPHLLIHFKRLYRKVFMAAVRILSMLLLMS